MHPGTNNDVLIPDCQWDHDFEGELAAILSPEVRRLAAAGQAEISNFRALYDNV